MSAKIALTIGYLAIVTKGSDVWKFIEEYPVHQAVDMLTEGQTILIDGKPDENAWALTDWTEYQWVSGRSCHNFFFLSIYHKCSGINAYLTPELR